MSTENIAKSVHQRLLNILDSFQRHQVELKIVTAPMLGESASSQFMLNLLASFAEFEYSLISDRIQESIRARRRGGGRLSGNHHDIDGQVANDVDRPPHRRASIRRAAAEPAAGGWCRSTTGTW